MLNLFLYHAEDIPCLLLARIRLMQQYKQLQHGWWLSLRAARLQLPPTD